LGEVRHFPLGAPSGLPLRIKFENGAEIARKDEVRRGGIREDKPRVLGRDSRLSESVVSFLGALHFFAEYLFAVIFDAPRYYIIEAARAVAAPETHVPLRLNAKTEMPMPRQLRERRARKSFDGESITNMLEGRRMFRAYYLTNQAVRFLSSLIIRRILLEILLGFLRDNLGRPVTAVAGPNGRQGERLRTVIVNQFHKPGVLDFLRDFKIELIRKVRLSDKFNLQGDFPHRSFPPFGFALSTIERAF